MHEHFNFDRVIRDLQMFPEENVFIYMFEEAVSEPETFARRLFTFLGVDPDFKPSLLRTPINVRYEYRWRKFHLLMLEFFIRIYGRQKGKVLFNSPHIRPIWVNALLRLNQKNAKGFQPHSENVALIQEKTLPYIRTFLDVYDKWDEWGYAQWR